MKRSFRDLLAIRFALITTAGITVCVVGSYFILRRTLDSELRANILNVAAIQAAALTDRETGEMHFHEWDLTPAEAASVRELVRYAQVWSGNGESLLRSQYMTGDLPLEPEALRLSAAGQLVWEDASFEGIPVRSVFYPLVRLGDMHAEHVLQVAAPLEGRNTLLGRAALSGFLLIVLVGIGSVLGGRWLAIRAIRPVTEIIDEAEAVGAGSLRRRIGAHADTHEYERLVHVLNDMLDRIQAAFEVQRRFTADASHELRSPLTAMRGELELALRRDRGTEEYKEVLVSACEEVMRLSRIVEGLLILARSDSGAVEPRLERADLTKLVGQAIARTSGDSEAHSVQIELVAPDPVPGVFDPDLVTQMAGNLVQNAVRFAGTGGRVTVTVTSEEGEARISVEDSGPGIPAGSELAIFERFWRADPSRSQTMRNEGTGLGLAIAKVIAEQHGGSVTASNDSRLGGARIEVRIPTLFPHSEATAPARGPAPTAASS